MNPGLQANGSNFLGFPEDGESALPVAEILADRHIPFVFTTGADDAPDGKFHDAPVLLKPFTVKELRLALQRILSN